MSNIPFNPGRGAEAMAAASEAAGKGGSFDRYKRFKLADKEEATVRFITPIAQMITVMCHNYCPTKGAPNGYTGSKWPDTMSAVCRYDKAFGGYFKDCYICDLKVTNKWGNVVKPNPKTFAIACLRVMFNGAMIDMPRDYTVKDKEGAEKPVHERALVLVDQAQGNFWDGLRVYGSKYGTLSDRDYSITRQGGDKDTKYIPTHEGPDQILHPGVPAWAIYAEEMARQGLDLDKIVSNQASDEFYAKFFDERVNVDKDGTITPATGGATPAATAVQKADADDRLAALRQAMDADAAPSTPSAPADPWATPAGVGAGAGDPWATSGPAF